MMDRFTTIFFGKWFVLLFFGAQSYWQVDGLLKDASTGRVIETLSWIALSVLLFFIAWKIGWSRADLFDVPVVYEGYRRSSARRATSRYRLDPNDELIDRMERCHFCPTHAPAKWAVTAQVASPATLGS